MTLTFPNRMRSFDETLEGVRFLGHDGMFEVPFLVETEALAELRGTATEANSLAAFDAARDTIYNVARALYAQGRRSRYVLTAADFGK